MAKRAGRKFGQKTVKEIMTVKVKTNKNHFHQFSEMYGKDISDLLKQFESEENIKITKTLSLWIDRL